jgi:UDP-2,3-diacylglucosamine hydrolase
MKPLLFLSDIHLAPDRPEATAAFNAFCAGPARAAGAVYILGDLFDSWIGDDQLTEPFTAAIAGSLRGITQSGVPVYVGHGNRDFLLGTRFAAETGVSLLPERQLIDIAGGSTLLSHGDELCTGDVAYQQYRSRMRDPATQRRLLGLPLFVRRMIARWLRRKSRNATSLKPASIMDVDDATVVATFRDFGVSRMIHGHTHRPATHRVDVDGRMCERIVLADWHDRGHYVEVDGSSIRSREIAAQDGAAAARTG